MDMEFANERERLKKEVGFFLERRQFFFLGVFFFVVEESWTIKNHQKEGCFVFFLPIFVFIKSFVAW